MKKIFLIFFLALVFLSLFSETAKAAALCDESKGGEQGLVPCGNKEIDQYICEYAVDRYPKLTIGHVFKNATKVFALNPCINNKVGVDDQKECTANCKRLRPRSAPNSEFDEAIFTNRDLCTNDCLCKYKTYEYKYDTVTLKSVSQEGAQVTCNLYSTTDPRVTKDVKKAGKTPSCPCEIRHVFLLMLNIYKFAVLKIAFPLAAFMVVLGGVLLLVSAGNPGLAGTAKNILKFSAIGLGLILGSWLIIDIVLKAIGYSLQWNVF